ncbi:MAG TPA: methyltransferase domain-containing protein [Longimicrobium sp.]|nr:methyltransferase domain-containing protein [Longimicrobium sp.]
MSPLPRAAGAERMDEPGQDPRQLAVSLADLRRVNRWLGGTRVVLRHLAGLVERHPREHYRILDVATGSGDIPLQIARWADEEGLDVDVVATDNHETTLELAREHVDHELSVRAAFADARRLPFADEEFDIALISTALHHFDDERDCVRVLRELHRVSRIGFIVNDLARSRTALLGARLLAATVWRRHPVTRHDGPLSVRRSFTPDELRALAAKAGFGKGRVHAHFPFRVALVVEKE